MKNRKIGFVVGLVLAMLTLTVMAAPAIAADWPQFHYDIANAGCSPSDAPDDNTLMWVSTDIGAAASSQAMIVGDKVFVYADDEVYALNKASGAVLWQTSIPGDTLNYGSWASPAYDDDMLFVSAGYNLTKLNAADGTKLQEIAFPDGGYSCNGGPTVADGMVFAGSGFGSPAHYYAFNESDLTDEKWNFSVAGSALSTPAVADNKVVFGESIYGNPSDLYCVNEATGALIWNVTLSGHMTGSAAIDAANNRVYVATYDGLLHAINFTNGNEDWNVTILPSASTPAIWGDYIYVSGNTYGSNPGRTYCINSAGVEQWNVTSGSWVISPAIADGKLFTGNIDAYATTKGIYAYNATTGAPVWSYDDAGSSPSVAESEGMVVSIGNDGKVYAFGTPESVDIEVVDPTECVPRQSQFNVPIVIDTHGLEVYGVQYVLSFNSSVLRAETQVQGDFLSDSGADDTIVVINTVDNTAGETEYAETRSGTTDGIAGSGTIATVTFTAIGDVGSSTTLSLSEVLIVDNDEGEIKYEITNSTVKICINEPPVANAIVYDDYNNVGSKYLCKVYFDASASNDPDGNITYYRWDFGDGDYGTGMIKEHVYTSWNWDNTTGYEPFNVSLTVTDDTPEPETGTDTTYFDVIVYIAGDANGDGIVNIIDASMVGLEWGESCTPPGTCWRDIPNTRADKADLNNDHEVNILDAVIIGTTWKHTAWGDV